jgi:hypothetical protein
MKVAFIGNNTVAIDINNDTMVSDNGMPVAATTVAQFACTTQAWGIEEDMNGHKCLTLDKGGAIPYYIDVLVNGIPHRYENVELIGGRPPVIRK